MVFITDFSVCLQFIDSIYSLENYWVDVFDVLIVNMSYFK